MELANFFATVKIKVCDEGIGAAIMTDINLTEEEGAKIKDILFKAMYRQAGLTEEEVNGAMEELKKRNYDYKKEILKVKNNKKN